MRAYWFCFWILAALAGAACGDPDSLPMLTITTTALPSGTEGIPYSATLQASDGTAPYIWNVASGDLPAGLALDGPGVVSGTPTAPGSSSFTVRVTDSGSPAQSSTKPLSITVSPEGAFSITTTSLPNGTTGVAYSATLTAIGGITPYTWQVDQELPDGLMLNPATGVISGTPTTMGSFSSYFRVTDNSLPAQEVFQLLGFTVNHASELSITTTSLPDGATGVAYSTTLTATGGTTPYTWQVDQDLPDGLALNPATGVISGTPTTMGGFNSYFRVTDSSQPPQEAFQLLGFTVNYASLLSITTTSLPDGATGVAYSTTLTATGGITPYVWQVDQELPDGLMLNPATGVISGTPTTMGSFSSYFRVTDNSLPAQEAFQLLGFTVN